MFVVLASRPTELPRNPVIVDGRTASGQLLRSVRPRREWTASLGRSTRPDWKVGSPICTVGSAQKTCLSVPRERSSLTGRRLRRWSAGVSFDRLFGAPHDDLVSQLNDLQLYGGTVPEQELQSNRNCHGEAGSFHHLKHIEICGRVRIEV